MEVKEIYINELIDKIRSDIDNFCNKSDIISVILTGSLGRDEGTFRLGDAGELRLISDIELALVYKPGCKRSAKELKQKLIDSYSEEMNPMTISLSRVKNKYNFNYSFKTPKYSSIFMYDLYNGSKTIWGEDLISSTESVYDKYEAKRIVANRIGELIYLKDIVKTDEEQVKQWEGKLLLAIGTAYCIIKNAYMSPYKTQYKFIMDNKDMVNELIGIEFTSDYETAYNYLRMGSSIYNVEYSRLIVYVDNISKLLCSEEYRKPSINSFSRKLKYMVACKRKKVSLNIFKCETEIIDNLIDYFRIKDDNLLIYSEYWKKVLY